MPAGGARARVVGVDVARGLALLGMFAVGLWTLEFPYTEVGFFGTSEVPAVGVLRFDAERGLVVGLWAKAEVYPFDEAVAVAQRVAASVGVSPP